MSYSFFTSQGYFIEKFTNGESPVEILSGSLPTAVDQKVLARLDAAKGLEAAFIAEMLKSIAPDTSSQAFGGGIGEEQFQSFLFENQARAMVDRGGIGLAEQFVRSMERMP